MKLVYLNGQLRPECDYRLSNSCLVFTFLVTFNDEIEIVNLENHTRKYIKLNEENLIVEPQESNTLWTRTLDKTWGHTVTFNKEDK